MAAQARLSCPVRCATISPGLPKLLRATSHASRASILQNKPNLQKCGTNRNLCIERTYESTTARNSRKNKANLQKCKNESNFRACPPAERRPRVTSHGSRTTILQNEPNFQARPPANRTPRVTSHEPRVTPEGKGWSRNGPGFPI